MENFLEKRNTKFKELEGKYPVWLGQTDEKCKIHEGRDSV